MLPWRMKWGQESKGQMLRGWENRESLWPWGRSKARKAERVPALWLWVDFVPEYKGPHTGERVLYCWHRSRKPLGLMGRHFPARTDVFNADCSYEANSLWDMSRIDSIVLKGSKEIDISSTHESLKSHSLYIKRSRRSFSCTLNNSNFE